MTFTGKYTMATLMGLVAIALLAVTACSSDSDSSLPGEGVSVQPARATWDTGYFNEALYSRALETLGFEVKDFLELDNPVFYQQVALGDVDFWANGWFPSHQQYEETFSGGAEIAGTVIPLGGLEGYLVDKAGADEFGITHLGDFARPEVAKAYDTDGNGKANMVGCPDGWGCNNIQIHHFEDLELNDFMDHGTVDYNIAMADLLARFKNDEHVLFYTWTPNWTVDVLQPGSDVVWIGVPKPSSPLEITEADMTHEGIPGAVESPLLTGWSASDIQVVANSEFLSKNPAAKKLFDVMGLELSMVANQNNLMNQGEDSQVDTEKHVTDWIVENQSTWDSWLEQAKSAS